jgi:hypothetical protein
MDLGTYVKYVTAGIVSAIIIPPLLILAAIWDISRHWARTEWEWED